MERGNMRSARMVHQMISILCRKMPGSQNGMASVLVSLVAVTCIAGAFAAQGETGMCVSFLAESPQVGLFEPVFAKFSIQNNSNEPIKFDLGLNKKAAFEFSIDTPDGKRLRSHPFEQLPDGGLGAKGNVTLSPGETYTQRLLLNEWYDFPNAGTYTVALSVNFRLQTMTDRQIGSTAPDPIAITVGEKNENRLRDICADLTTKALVEDFARLY
jgi:hypothetical protein